MAETRDGWCLGLGLLITNYSDLNNLISNDGVGDATGSLAIAVQLIHGIQPNSISSPSSAHGGCILEHWHWEWLAQPLPKTHKRHAKVAARHGVSIEHLVINLPSAAHQSAKKRRRWLAACGLACTVRRMQTQRPAQSCPCQQTCLSNQSTARYTLSLCSGKPSGLATRAIRSRTTVRKRSMREACTPWPALRQLYTGGGAWMLVGCFT
ncbi:uncharacterized protein CC84DRAFT_564282 [Paraphaeosphaeria sporulosa]|uniref:Uncharacterized protein n=1 Tax=Paraphaeosphaeria sporulosa TaxID=1460663 RepID=A0A177CN94_9PLEO|nr:uncharacterized protein CC84DRAFT_564282 [Paraphaeosphaeria sporulosa]OAG08299.1 hypothetical protein CC84DRAFT_564282 [Paraphaeosphaeria sporulosa]